MKIAIKIKYLPEIDIQKLTTQFQAQYFDDFCYNPLPSHLADQMNERVYELGQCDAEELDSFLNGRYRIFPL